jgi:hypothetical protein
VRQYLDDAQTKSDDKPRVENWLSTYVGAEDTPYTRAVGELFLTAAVRRVRRPGVKFDFVMVLVGPQDAGKSSVGMALVPDDSWFEDGLVLGSTGYLVRRLRRPTASTTTFEGPLGRVCAAASPTCETRACCRSGPTSVCVVSWPGHANGRVAATPGA